MSMSRNANAPSKHCGRAKRRFGAWSTPTSLASSSGIFDGRILEANEAFLDIVGYDHEDLVAAAYGGRISRHRSGMIATRD
jgi:hypothetical protein